MAPSVSTMGLWLGHTTKASEAEEENDWPADSQVELWRGWHWRFAVYRVTMIPFLLPGWAGLQTTEYTARELVRRRLYSDKKSS